MNTDESIGKYEVEDSTENALEMLGAGYEEYKVRDNSGDRKYFSITPRIVAAYARNAHDLALWETVKDVAGESGECYLNTEQLAILAGISAGQVSESRKYWMKIGFLAGELKKDPGYTQKVWHLSVPDIWTKNVEWCEKYPKISDRIAFRLQHKSLHRVKASPTEGLPSPTERKKKLIKKTIKPSSSEDGKPKANAYPELVLFKETTKRYPHGANWEDVISSVKKVSLRLGRDATRDDLVPFYKFWTSKGYNPLGLGWLEWAVRGQIPANGKVAEQWSKPTNFDANMSHVQNWLNKQDGANV